MLQLLGTINHFCFWLLHCSRIVLLNPSKWRLDLRMISNGFKWGCAQAILSLSISGSGVGHYQSVLIALAADLHSNKPWQGQHKFWKYVSPIRTYFAWLPEQLARTYCGAALDRHPGLPYGEVHHLQGSESDFRHSMVFQNISHIGDTKSAQELEVFLRMSRERLRLCCGIQCTDSLHPNGPRQRQKLFTAALKLLRFAIGIETVRCENEAQRALHAALLPLLRLEDGHVLATLSAIVLALCEGKGVLDWLSVASLELAKLVLLRPFWLDYWSLTRASN